jgi:hypothetical protein
VDAGSREENASKQKAKAFSSEVDAGSHQETRQTINPSWSATEKGRPGGGL